MAGAEYVMALAFDNVNGELRELNTQLSDGENSVFVVVHQSGRWGVNANSTQAGVSVFSVRAYGSFGLAGTAVPVERGKPHRAGQARRCLEKPRRMARAAIVRSG